MYLCLKVTMGTHLSLLLAWKVTPIMMCLVSGVFLSGGFSHTIKGEFFELHVPNPTPVHLS